MTCYGCERCGYKAEMKLSKCPTCGVAMEEVCCKCSLTKSDCDCE